MASARRVITGAVLALTVAACALASGAPSTPVGSPAWSAPPASAGGSPSPDAGGSPQPSVTLTPQPSVSPEPGPALVPAPLTGRLVTEAAARRHPIAVMIDDLSPARPQSGFSAASVVWQAPAEGGIPRYMMIFAETRPTDVGPVRSARYYYIAWAAELNAAYVHAGGSPQALAALRESGSGQLVWNADQFAWGAYFDRVTDRFPPHNLYTDGKRLDELAKKLGALAPPEPIWKFRPDAPITSRPVGGRLQVSYLTSAIRYDYDRLSNTYLRTVSVEGSQKDAATGKRVAPKNVVIVLMAFGPLDDGSHKHRLEAQVIGNGTAWIATNGRTIKGTWRKRSLTGATRFFDAKGREVTLTIGQTFVNVLPIGSPVTIKAGALPPVDPRFGEHVLLPE